MFVPIFEKEGNRFFVLSKEFIGEDEAEACEIGIGAMFVECVICGMTYTNEVMEIDPENTPHVAARLGPLPTAIISGPLYQGRCSRRRDHQQGGRMSKLYLAENSRDDAALDLFTINDLGVVSVWASVCIDFAEEFSGLLDRIAEAEGGPIEIVLLACEEYDELVEMARGGCD